MEFVIRIYGAPYGFELDEGSAQELNYFQVFDNGSTEPVKMTVHRLNNSHQVSYNYLRYGYVTSGGRPGSFFGMSIVFNNSYCSEFTVIYQLFEAVYGTILEKAILFEELTTGQGQAKYKIDNFSNSKAQDEIRRIKGVLAQNIHGDGTLASSIRPIDFSSTASRDKEFRLSANVSNELVANAVNKYSVVTISPAYGSGSGNGGAEVKRIPVEDLMKFPTEKNAILTKATEWSNTVSAFLIKLRAHQDNELDVEPLSLEYKTLMKDLGEFSEKIKKFLDNIEIFHKIEPSHSYFGKGVQKEVTTAKDNVNTLLESLVLYKKIFDKGGSGGTGGSGSNGGGSETGGSGSNGGSGGTGGSGPRRPSAFEEFIHKNKKMLITAGVFLCLIVGGVAIYNILRDGNPEGPGPIIDTTVVSPKPTQTVTQNTDSLKQEAYRKYEANRYGEAYKDYSEANEIILAEDCKKECMNEAKRKSSKDVAIKYFKDEMAKGGYTMTDQDQNEIKNAFPANAGGNKDKAQTTATPKYTIVLIQDGQQITGKITKKREITLKCLENGNKEVSVSNWTVGTSRKPDGKFTPQKTDKSFKISCTVNGKKVEKTIECDIKEPGAPI